MPQKKLGFAYSLDDPHCEGCMLGKNLIVVAGPVNRRFGDAQVFGVALGHRVYRDQGVAVIISAVHSWAADKVNDRNAVPDPICIVVTIGTPSPGLVKACKARGAELIVLREGYAAVLVATNGGLAHGTVLHVLDKGKDPPKPKRPRLKRSKPKPKPEVEPKPDPKPVPPVRSLESLADLESFADVLSDDSAGGLASGDCVEAETETS